MQQKRISIKAWGKIEEKEVFLYALYNGSYTLKVTNYGAIVQSWMVPGNNGEDIDIVLGYDSLDGYQNDTFYMGAVVGRYAGRLAAGKFSIEGEPFQLDYVSGAYTLHGGKSGFNAKVWTTVLLSHSNDDTQKRDENISNLDPETDPFIEFEYLSKDKEEGFPGMVTVRVRYTLGADGSWNIVYKATSTKSTPINLTQHSYFNLSGNQSSSINEHELMIPSDFYAEINQDQLPTGKLNKVAETPFDFTSYKKIGNLLISSEEALIQTAGYDHSYLLDHGKKDKLTLAACARLKSSGLKLCVFTDAPTVHFYSGNFLKNSTGKLGSNFTHRTGFCLETQYLPDSPNHPEFPTTILKPGAEFTSKTVFKVSVCY